MSLYAQGVCVHWWVPLQLLKCKYNTYLIVQCRALHWVWVLKCKPNMYLCQGRCLPKNYITSDHPTTRNPNSSSDAWILKEHKFNKLKKIRNLCTAMEYHQKDGQSMNTLAGKRNQKENDVGCPG